MTSLFADIETLVSNAVDGVYGEQARILRQSKNQYFAGSADSSRPTTLVTAVFDKNPVLARPQDEGNYDGFQPQVGADRYHVSINKRLFADKSLWPAQGDRIEAVNNPSIPMLRVTRPPEDDGIGRIVCICEKAQ